MKMIYNINDIDVNLEELEKALLDLKKEREEAISKANEALNKPLNWPLFLKPKALGSLKIEDCYGLYNGYGEPILFQNYILMLDELINIIKDFKCADAITKAISFNNDFFHFIYCNSDTGDEEDKFIGFVSKDITRNSKINKPTLTFTVKTRYLHSIDQLRHHSSITLPLPKKIQIIVNEIPALYNIFATIKVPMSVEIPNFKEEE